VVFICIFDFRFDLPCLYMSECRRLSLVFQDANGYCAQAFLTQIDLMWLAGSREFWDRASGEQEQFSEVSDMLEPASPDFKGTSDEAGRAMDLIELGRQHRSRRQGRDRLENGGL
jgi:hypothetical protein